MRFREILESKHVEDMAHEVLTYHGFVPREPEGNLNLWAYDRSPDFDYRALHRDLEGQGWKRAAARADHPSEGDFTHPDHPHILSVYKVGDDQYGMAAGLAKPKSLMWRDRHLEEGPLSPIPPTPRFVHVHGNYCGPGNRGGDPVDALDAACQKHDVGYHYTPDPVKRLKHDSAFVKAVSSIAADKSHPVTVRAKARVMADVFQGKLKAISRTKNQMLFKEVFGKEVENLTHEVLSSHGLDRFEDSRGWGGIRDAASTGKVRC